MNPPESTQRTTQSRHSLNPQNPRGQGACWAREDQAAAPASLFWQGLGAAGVALGMLLAATPADAQWEYRDAAPDPETRTETYLLAEVGDSIPDSLVDTRVNTYSDGSVEPAPDMAPIESYGDEGYAPGNLDDERFDQANYYFPTRFELDQARDQTDRSRLRSRDAQQLAYYGQWDEGTGPDQDGFYYRNRRAFTPINRSLQFLSPETISLFEANELGRGGFSFNSGLPVTRNFDPNAAHVKAGPLFFDLLSVQAGAIWSDFNGDRTFLEGEEPGWLFYIGFTGRAVVRLTDQFYLTAEGDVYYLPRSNQVGLGFNSRLGLGTSTFARLNYLFYPGQWEILAYAEAGVTYYFGDLLGPLREDSIERRGRYDFGRADRGNTRAFDFSSDNVYPYGEAGLLANRPFGSDWRLFTGVIHREVWRSFDFEDRRTRDEAYVRTVYQSAIWPVAPYAEYRILSPDRFDTFRHRAVVGSTARLTQYLTADAEIGYFWTTGNSSDDRSNLVWSFGLQHDLTERTYQTFRIEQDYRMNDLNDEYFGTQATYTINHQFTNYMRSSAFANYFYGDDLTLGENDIESWRLGLRTGVSLYCGTDLNFVPFYDETLRKGSGSRSERLILRGTLRKEIWTRLVGEAGYQYEDFSRDDTGFNEHLIFMNLTRYF